MKKLFIILLITASLTVLLLPTVSYAECPSWNIGCQVTEFFYKTLITGLGNIVLSLAAWILWCGGVILNFSISYLVLEMKTRIGGISAIYYVWKSVRDLANMFFIFILLAIAIQTILQIGNYKTMIRNVILVALFINFSFFLTGVLIDTSNIIAIQFYKGIGSTAIVGPTLANDGGMTLRVTQALGLSKIYGMSSNVSDRSATSSATMKNSAGLSASGPNDVIPFITMVIFGSILMVITAGIFLASAIMIGARFVQLIILLMFSPLAFAALALPAAKKYWSKWWNKLVAQLIFAPAYFMFLWVTMAVITSDMFVNGLTGGGKNFSDAFKGSPSSLTGLIINFIIVILMLGYSLVLAKELGAAGVDTATKASKGLQSFVGRNTAGRFGSRIANSQAMQYIGTKSPLAGRLLQKPFDSLAKQSWGGKKGGFDQAEKDSIKRREEQAKRLGPSTLMIENAKGERTAASTNLNNQRKAAENAANEKYGEEETRTSQQIEAAEREATDQEAEVKRLAEIENNPGKSKEEQSAAQGARLRTEQSLADKRGAIANMKRNQTSMRETKQAEIDAFMKKHEERAQKANENADRIMGVDKDEATKRAKAEGKTGDDIGKRANEIMDENKGIAKERQEQYAKSVEGRDFGVPISKAASAVSNKISGVVPGKTGKALGYTAALPGKILAGLVNAGTNRTTRVSQGAGIRKNVIKGKSEAEKFYEAAKKEIAEASSSTENKPNEGGGEAKSGGEGEKPKTT